MSVINGHYRIPFKSNYLSAADLNDPIVLTVSHVVQEMNANKGKNSSELLNVAYFEEKELQPGYKLKPMVLNATNSKALMRLCGGSKSVFDWKQTKITIFAQQGVRQLDGTTGEGLRINPNPPRLEKLPVLPDTIDFKRAIVAYKRDGNLSAVLKSRSISDAVQQQIIEAAKND